MRKIATAIIILVFIDILALYSFDGEIREKVNWTFHKVISAFKEKEKAGREYVYVCPMHPFYRRDQEGECGICGMTLVKKKRSELSEEAGSTIVLSTRQVQLGGILTEKIKRRSLTKRISTYGRVDYDERKIKVATAWVPGRIDRLFVDFTGVTVKKGDPLVWLYSPSLISTQKEYLLAIESLKKVKDSHIEETVKNAQSLVKSTRQRLLWWGITPDQIKRLEESKEVKEHVTIHAPVGGTVIHKHAFEGMYVKEGTVLYKIAPLDTVWVYADIYESDISLVQPGQAVDIETRMNAINLTGRISFIDPFLNPGTRTAKVRITVENPEGRLKPGMYAEGIINVPLGRKLTVEESAVLHEGSVSYVFLQQGKGVFEPIRITPGHKVGEYYEVLSGLEEGDEVVIAGNFLLNSEASLRGALKKMMEGTLVVYHEKKERVGISKKFKEQFNKTLESYLKIKRELAADSIKGVEKETDKILSALKDKDTLKFKSEVSTILEAAGRISRLTDIEDVREGFLILSNGFVGIAEKTRPQGIYVFECPMKEGAVWLDTSRSVKNPYFGKDMLTCGNLKEIK